MKKLAVILLILLLLTGCLGEPINVTGLDASSDILISQALQECFEFF